MLGNKKTEEFAADLLDEQVRLTPEQIQNWRNVLKEMIGLCALVIPDERVQKYRDDFQKKVISKEPSKWKKILIWFKKAE